MIARNLGISARNDYAMLERIGEQYSSESVTLRISRNWPTMPNLANRS